MTGPPLRPDAGSIVIVCPSWLGDVVMATPVYRAVRAHCPDTRLTAVLRPGLGAVLDGAPWFDDCVECDFRGAGGLLRGARRLRPARPDAALLLPNSFRSALTAMLARIRTRAGYARDARRLLLTHSIEPAPRDPPTSTVEDYARLGAWAIGVPSIDRRLELHVTETERSAANAFVDSIGPYVVLVPGGVRSAKRWPVDRFARLAERLHEREGLSVVVSGAPGERELTTAIGDASSCPILDLAAHALTLGVVKAVIARAALVISNDTGPRHIAAALDVPIVTLFGPTDHRWTTLEDAREHRLLAEPFLPEELVADRHARACAIDRIEVGDVLFAAQRLLAADSSVSTGVSS